MAGRQRRGLLTALDTETDHRATTMFLCVWVKVGPGPAPYTNGTIASEAHDCELRSRCPRFIGESKLGGLLMPN
jgi:hypothetical protein